MQLFWSKGEGRGLAQRASQTPFLSFAMKGLERPLQRIVFNFQMSLPEENLAAIFRNLKKKKKSLPAALSANVMLQSKADEC